MSQGATKIYGVMGEFADPQDLVRAGRAARDFGYSKLDAYSPFPVHGIDDAIGVARSKLGWIVVCFSFLGMGLALLLQWGTGAGNPAWAPWWSGMSPYPLVIGGKPLFDFTFSIPVTFELTVLLSAFAAVIGMFALNGLPRLYHPSFKHSSFHRATDDRFLLVIEASDPLFDAEEGAKLLRSLGAHAVEVVEE